MKLKTPRKKPVDDKSVTAFIEGAERKSPTKITSKPKKLKNSVLPWNEPHLRDDITKVFNLRLSEKHFLMLKYLAENQRKESMQSICLDALEPMLERESLALSKKLNHQEK